MKKSLFIVGNLIFTAIIVIFLVNINSPVIHEKALQSLPTEEFIQQHLLTSDFKIRTNFQGKENDRLYLSESSGLLLEYLVEKQDSPFFLQVFDHFRKDFMLDESIFAWKIEHNEVATTNALIDDLRVVEALFKEGERTNNRQLINEAKRLSKALLQYNGAHGFFADFYDTEYEMTNNQLTVSYVNVIPFQYMEKYYLINERTVMQMKEFLNGLETRNGFYPQTYQLETEQFLYDDIVNLIDQLYIVIHLERAGVRTDPFFRWLTSTYDKDNKIFGRYDAHTKDHMVEYESVAVYALAILYSMERSEEQFAKELWEKLLSLRVNDEASTYFGGYVDLASNNTHSFDNLLALLAERRLKNEKIIE